MSTYGNTAIIVGTVTRHYLSKCTLSDSAYFLANPELEQRKPGGSFHTEKFMALTEVQSAHIGQFF